MLRISATTLFVLLAATGCKKDKKTEPAMGSDKPAMGSDTPAAGSDTPAAGSGSAAGSADGSAAGSGSAAAAPAGELKWEKYTSKEGGFTIDLPAKAEESDQGGMKIVGAQFGTTASDDRTAMCGVAYMNLPPDTKVDAKVMLDGATSRHKQGAKVVEEKDVKLGTHPGRSIVVENDSHRKWIRVYIVDKAIYVLNCGGPFDRAATDGPIATKTLDSFALSK